MSQVASEHLGESLGTDFFSVREQFTDEQWSHFITVRRFVDEEVVPVVGAYWERAEICWPLTPFAWPPSWRRSSMPISPRRGASNDAGDERAPRGVPRD